MNDIAKVEQVLMQGDLSKLSPGERVTYYNAVCASLKLNPLAKPFDFIMLNGKLTFYAKRDCTEQLRKRDGVSITSISATKIEDVYVVTATAQSQDGRSDSSTGAVPIKGLSGDNLANALMKAETKAKRRVTLSLCGLGLFDETELDTVKPIKDTRSLKEKLGILPKEEPDPTPLVDAVITATWPPEPEQIGQPIAFDGPMRVVDALKAEHPDFNLQLAAANPAETPAGKAILGMFPDATFTVQPLTQIPQEVQRELEPGPAITGIDPGVFPMGKHKGQPMDTIPEGYLKWAVANMTNQAARGLAASELARRAEA